MHGTAARFRRAVEAKDPDAMEALLADDVVFRSPAVFKPYEGKVATMVLLRSVVRVFEDFRYTREFHESDGRGHVLAFEARVGERALEGIDMLRLDDAGQIVEFVVMIRPLSGLQALVDRMGEVVPEVMAEMGVA